MNYQALYAILGGLTPLNFNCGMLCNASCCSPHGDATGMYVFPGEEGLLRGVPGFTITTTTLQGYGKVQFLTCAGECDRSLRPLSCRVFPLAPRMKDGELVRPRLDPRGRPICPLCHKSIAALSPEFVSAVGEVFSLLFADEKTRPFVEALCRQTDNFSLNIRAIRIPTSYKL